MLPREAAEREAISSAMAQVMSAWGFQPVETPVAEELSSLQAGAGGTLEGTAFRLFDSDGTLLALRPEMTVPIARLVATRLAGQPGPFRLRYTADVFREQASLRGQARQFTQVGLESIGVSGPAADAEVIAVLVESLRASGLIEFTVGVGTVAVLRSIIDTAEMDESWGAAVFDAAHDRNLVGIDALAAREGVPDAVANALRTVPQIRGDRTAIKECRRASAECGCEDALDALDATWDLLEAAGVADSVSVDFGIMRSFDYYTGVVLEVYAPGLGLPIGGGGRYDDVMGQYGTPMPAAGFAIGVERLHIALAEQKVAVRVRRLDALLGGETADAFREAARLRAAGWNVRFSERTGLDLVREARDTGAAEALLADGERVVRLDRAGEPALPLEEPLPEPPTATWVREGGAER